MRLMSCLPECAGRSSSASSRDACRSGFAGPGRRTRQLQRKAHPVDETELGESSKREQCHDAEQRALGVPQGNGSADDPRRAHVMTGSWMARSTTSVNSELRRPAYGRVCPSNRRAIARSSGRWASFVGGRRLMLRLRPLRAPPTSAGCRDPPVGAMRPGRTCSGCMSAVCVPRSTMRPS